MIVLDGRKMNVPKDEQLIGFDKDNLVEVRQFKITDTWLFDYSFKLDIKVGGKIGIFDLEKEVFENYILLTWTVLREHLANGFIFCQLRAFTDDGEMWHSEVKPFRCKGSINAADYFSPYLPTEFEEMERRITIAKNEVLNAERQTAEAESNALNAAQHSDDVLAAVRDLKETVENYKLDVVEKAEFVEARSDWTQELMSATETLKNLADISSTAAQNAARTAAEDAQAATRAKESAARDAARAEDYADSINPDELDAKINLKGDNLYFDEEEKLLYLMSNGERIGDGIAVSTGGGGGGGGATNNAVLSLSNTSGFLSKSVSEDSNVVVTFRWSSLEDEMPTGNGSMTIKVNNTPKLTKNVSQGDVAVDISSIISSGSNSVKISIMDAYGNTRSINFIINVISLRLASNFDATIAYSGDIQYTYTPTGSAAKTVHFELNGEEISTVTVNSSGRQQNFTIPAQSHGSHHFKVWFTATVDGEEVSSNVLDYDLICVEEGNTTPIVAVDFFKNEIAQFETAPINYIAYHPQSLSSNVTLSVNGEEVSALTVDRTVQTWSYRADEAGTLSLAITCGSVTKTITLNVAETAIEVEAETENLELYLSSYGRSNNEAGRDNWIYGDISCVFDNFNFTSDGWQRDEKHNTVLRTSGDARLTIPLLLFAQDFRTTGKTIEIEFATRNVLNYDATIISCFSGDRGLNITAQKALLKSEQSEISTQYKEDEHIRLSFVVEKRAEFRLIYIYLNGIMSGTVQYPDDDDFSQTEPVNITIGSNECTVDLYTIRVYNNSLTRYQILDNFIADTPDITEKLARYERNRIFNEYGDIVIEQLPKDVPYIVFETEQLPQYKGNKLKVSGYYVDPTDDRKSFVFYEAEIDVQGTSSAGYARKNYKTKFKNGVEQNGEHKSKITMNAEAIPTSTFTFKADVASSEGANNVELVRLFNRICPYKTPPQLINSKIRQGIDGFPMIVFQDDGNGARFIGKYNFNNDKGTPEVFGFAEGDESWEVLNNTSNRVLFKSADFSGDDWKNDFEARYPEDNEAVQNLEAFVAWVMSTDQTTATGDELPEAVTYEETEYTHDTAEYRLEKFKAELDDYVEIDSAVFYYLFTELFLMVDSRAKNMFPTMYTGNKFCFIPYDFDTAIGINNEGALAFGYELEDIDRTKSGAFVFNGQESVLWVNLRQAFFDEIKSMYQSLRSDGKLSYNVIETAFEEHQSKWCEAIWNEDAWYKYLQPLVEQNTAAYLSMLQGSKEQQRKWWLYNRFRYIDSKYNAGDSLSDFITLRGYAKSDITVVPYADIYASIKFGSYLVQQRALRGSSYTLACPLDNVNDTEIYIYSSSQLKNVGDLSGLKVGYADFSMATKLQSLKLGDSDENYSNENLTELYLGNNALIGTIDVRNCPNLGTGDTQQAVDISGCINIENVYFDGTAIKGCSLPNGGILKVLHLPDTLTNLTIRNQTAITDFAMPGYSNIATLRLENVSSAIDSKAILMSIADNSRVRLIGINWNFDSAEDALAVYDKLYAMRGLDENGNNTEKAQVSGMISVPSLTGAQLADMQSRYPDVQVAYLHITSNLYFYNGTTLIKTVAVNDGGDGAYSGSTPTKASTAQYTYTFAGWGLSNGGSVDANALKNVTADRNVYAIYTSTIRKYTVRFYNGSTLLQTNSNVSYGSSVSFTGTTPTKDGVSDPENYTFSGWSPSPSNIQGDTSCYAQFNYIGIEETITDSWDEIIAACNDGTYATKYSIGDTKIIDLGTEGTVTAQIAAFDADEKADGEGTAHITWITEYLLKTSHRMNPSLVSNYSYSNQTDWNNISKSSSMLSVVSRQYPEVANADMNFTATITVPNNAAKLTVKQNGVTTAKTSEFRINDGELQSFVSTGTGDTTIINNLEVTPGETLTLYYKTTSLAKDSSSKITVKIYFYDENGTALNHSSIVATSVSSEGSYRKSSPDSYNEGTGAIGGWEHSEMRTYLNETVKPLIPENVANAIIPVKKYSRSCDTAGNVVNNVVTTDDVWLPSQREVFGNLESQGPVYNGLFNSDNSRKKKRVGGSSFSNWWLRSAGGAGHFYCVNGSGGNSNNGAYYAGGVVLGFCT